MYADEEFVTPVCRAFNEGMQLFFLMSSIKMLNKLYICIISEKISVFG